MLKTFHRVGSLRLLLSVRQFCREVDLTHLCESLQGDAVLSERLRWSPSKTFTRNARRHDRIDMIVQGGGTIEGNINIAVDGSPLQKPSQLPVTNFSFRTLMACPRQQLHRFSSASTTYLALVLYPTHPKMPQFVTYLSHSRK